MEANLRQASDASLVPDEAESYRAEFIQLRVRLGLRLKGMQRVCPEALDLEARALQAVRDYVHGHSPDFAGERSDAVWRMVLLGDKASRTADISRLVKQAPEVAAAWLKVEAAECGYQLLPIGKPSNLPLASLTAELSIVAAALAKASLDAQSERTAVSEVRRLTDDLLVSVADVIAKVQAIEEPLPYRPARRVK
jgi:hypothetical protein